MTKKIGLKTKADVKKYLSMIDGSYQDPKNNKVYKKLFGQPKKIEKLTLRLGEKTTFGYDVTTDEAKIAAIIQKINEVIERLNEQN